MRAEGRDPATLQVTVGVSVEESADGTAALPHDAGAITDALGAWREAGVDHVQLGILLLTPETLEVALRAIHDARNADPTVR